MPEAIMSEPRGAMPVQVLINPTCRWKQADVGGGVLWYTGCGLEIAQEIIKAGESKIDEILNRQQDYSSGILNIDGKIIAWVDHIRSFPVFYAQGFVSNDARQILATLKDKSIDETAVLEFSTAGFVTGADTLYRDIKCLQPGEYLVHDTSGKPPALERYYQYIPAPEKSSWDENRKKLSMIIDEIILKIIRRANGRPIWVPLSAGLDSRLILCKLHEHGYKNLHTFTYGPRFNFEALHARRVAHKLNVPWHFVALSGAECRKIFHSPERRAYSDFADNLKAAPSFREFTALMAARMRGLIPQDAILINGQSGDYITGGHVAPFWYENPQNDKNDLFNVIATKHYSLWSPLKAPDNLKAISRKIESLLPALNVPPPFTQAAHEESWEYDARQVILVINGQRSYDFFGYDWELPLWERSLCDLFEHVPYDQKKGQALFKQYLREYDYKGLFAAREPKIWRWPLPMLWVVPMAQIVGLAGVAAKKKFYAIMRYFGHYSNQYAFFPFSLHKKTCDTAKNIFSLYVRHWFIENKFPLPAHLKNIMRIADDE